MPRGLGRTQRYVLQRLRELREQGDLRHHTAYSLAAAMTGEADPSPSAVQSVRQAIRRLAERGAIETTQIQGRAEGRPIEQPPTPRYVLEYLERAGLLDSVRSHGGGPQQPHRLMLGARLPLESIRAG